MVKKLVKYSGSNVNKTYLSVTLDITTKTTTTTTTVTTTTTKTTTKVPTSLITQSFTFKFAILFSLATVSQPPDLIQMDNVVGSSNQSTSSCPSPLSQSNTNDVDDDMTAVDQWLSTIKMARYQDTFEKAGIVSLAQVANFRCIFR